MRKVFFTVGPSQLYPTVPAHIETALRENVASISHRGKQFTGIYKQTTDNLRKLMGIPPGYHIFFLGSATEAMERIIQNTVETHSFHLVSGAFSKRFFTIASQLGKKAEINEVPDGRGVDVKSIKIPREAECICVTQNETSTGVSIPVSDISFLKQKNSSSLVALDVVSSAPNVEVDFESADLTFFSVQKLFGLPAGLGVLVVSPRAFEKSKNLFEKGVGIGSYHNFLIMEEYARKYQTPETPNVLGIYLLGKICGDFLEKGINNIRRETEEKARILYKYFETCEKYKPSVSEKKFRSLTTIVIDTQGETAAILPHLEKNGFIVSRGYGAFKEDQIRIANFPSQSLKDVKGLLSVFGKK